MSLQLLEPGFLLLLPAALLLLVLARLLRRRRFVASTTLAWLEPLLARPSLVRRLPAALAAAAFALVAVALTEPVLPFSQAEVKSLGLDVTLVLDLSSSMQELMDAPRLAATLPTPPPRGRDGTPAGRQGRTRLETTKQALRDFIARRRDDRIGLVVFSDHAYVVSPLTLDYDALLRYVEMVDDQILRGEGMTAIGDGIALANHLLTKQRGAARRDQVVLVFTDGEYNLGRDPVAVLAESAAAKIRVHLVGVDLEDEVKRKPAVRLLIDEVGRHGGRYYNADTERELRAVSRALDSLEKGLLTNKVYVRQAPVFHWFALPAVGLLVVAAGVRAIPYFADFT
jgi:Ca-activated chloride channel family protein